MQVHWLSALAPAAELLLDLQGEHVLASTAPTAVDQVAAPHCVHDCEPDDGLYVPATQAVHVPPLLPVYPALQVHWVMSVLPSGEFELAGHATQSDKEVAPVDARYLPAGHRSHDALPIEAL